MMYSVLVDVLQSVTLISDERMKENTSLGASVGGSKETTPPSCGDALLTLSANLPALMFHIDEDKVSEPCVAGWLYGGHAVSR